MTEPRVSNPPGPFLICLRNGPKHNPREQFAGRAEVWSRIGESEIWTFGPNAADFTEGRCRVICIGGLVRVHKQVARAQFMLRMLLRALWLRWFKRRHFVLLSPDPLANGLLAVAIKWCCRVPLVVEINGVFTNPANFIELPPELALRKQRRMLRLARWVIGHSDHLRLLYPEQVDDIPGSADVPRTVLLELYEEDRFERTELGRERILLFVGFPFFLKGIDYLLEAFSELRKTQPDWQLVLVGFNLERSALEIGSPTEGVTFTGPLVQDEVSGWMKRCQALILPSRAEGMGRVLLEAAKTGRARLGSRVDGIPHYVEDGVDGLLFDPTAEDALRVLERFCSDRALREELGRNAAERAAREFTVDRYVAEYRNLLERLDGPRAGGAPLPGTASSNAGQSTNSVTRSSE